MNKPKLFLLITSNNELKNDIFKALRRQESVFLENNHVLLQIKLWKRYQSTRLSFTISMMLWFRDFVKKRPSYFPKNRLKMKKFIFDEGIN